MHTYWPVCDLDVGNFIFYFLWLWYSWQDKEPGSLVLLWPRLTAQKVSMSLLEERSAGSHFFVCFSDSSLCNCSNFPTPRITTYIQHEHWNAGQMVSGRKKMNELCRTRFLLTDCVSDSDEWSTCVSVSVFVCIKVKNTERRDLMSPRLEQQLADYHREVLHTHRQILYRTVCCSSGVFYYVVGFRAVLAVFFSSDRPIKQADQFIIWKWPNHMSLWAQYPHNSRRDTQRNCRPKKKHAAAARYAKLSDVFAAGPAQWEGLGERWGIEANNVLGAWLNNM